MAWITAFADEISPDLSTQIATLQRLGLQGLDLRSVDGVNVLSLTDEQIDLVGSSCREAGLFVQTVSSPVNKVVLSEGNRVAEFAKLERACEVARRLGIRRIRIFTPEAPTEAWPEVKAWMADQLKLARAMGCVLLHENDAKFWGAYPEQAKILFEEFGSPEFRAAFDFANAEILGYRAMDHWFPWILPHLDTIHIKDAKDGKVVPPGEGDGQIKQTLSYLKSEGWEGPLTLEPHLQAAGPMGGFSGEQLFEVAYQALAKILDKVSA